MGSVLQDMAAIEGKRKGYYLQSASSRSSRNRVDIQHATQNMVRSWVCSTSPATLERLIVDLPLVDASLPEWMLFCLRCNVEINLRDRRGWRTLLMEPDGGSTMMLHTSPPWGEVLRVVKTQPCTLWAVLHRFHQAINWRLFWSLGC